MWGNTVAIHNVFKEKKSTKTIFETKHKKWKKKKKKTILEEKKQMKNENKWKKKHAGKVKAEFSTSSILKKNRQR